MRLGSVKKCPILKIRVLHPKLFKKKPARYKIYYMYYLISFILRIFCLIEMHGFIQSNLICMDTDLIVIIQTPLK